MSEAGDASFDALVDQYLGELAADEPTGASFLGLTEYDHQLSDHSAEAIGRRDAAERAWLERFGAVEAGGLSGAQQVDRDLLLAHLGKGVATADFESWKRHVPSYLENGVLELFIHGDRSDEAATEAAVARLALVAGVLEAARENLDPELMDPVLTGTYGLANVKGQIGFMREGLGDFVQDEGLRGRLEAAAREAAAHYESFAEFVEGLAAKASGDFAFGQERYDAVLRIGEAFDFGAHDVRQMGYEQMGRIEAEMAVVAGRLDGSAQWTEALERLQGDHPTSMDGMLGAYREETAKAKAFVEAKGIVPLPAGERCAVEPAPLAFRARAPVASYLPPAFYGAPTAGTFNVPFAPVGASAEEEEGRLRSNAFHMIPSVTVHEAYPGHHLHFAAALVSNPLRQWLTSTYMIEGWGLYTEQMMGEYGYYETDEAKLGQLAARQFRAARMVVDTSLHLGEMSMDEATAFMHQRGGLPEATARGEVYRYCSWPTQASSYLTGALEIERMAMRWTEGGHGSLAEFHQALVTSGKLPLGVAARAIGLGQESEQ
ncbi:MAG TPA: DUF885 domain-containing protein [Acidimicrobiales bacterium]|jgi:uncharacterized protein (DUF885 family)